jgi:hypothetical protein
MSVIRECCVLSGRGLCVRLNTRPRVSYRLWFVGVRLLGPVKGACGPESGRSITDKNYLFILGLFKGAFK